VTPSRERATLTQTLTLTLTLTLTPSRERASSRERPASAYPRSVRDSNFSQRESKAVAIAAKGLLRVHGEVRASYSSQPPPDGPAARAARERTPVLRAACLASPRIRKRRARRVGQALREGGARGVRGARVKSVVSGAGALLTAVEDPASCARRGSVRAQKGSTKKASTKKEFCPHFAWRSFTGNGGSCPDINTSPHPNLSLPEPELAGVRLGCRRRFSTAHSTRDGVGALN
jgi:hypothetical protein